MDQGLLHLNQSPARIVLKKFALRTGYYLRQMEPFLINRTIEKRPQDFEILLEIFARKFHFLYR